MPQSLIRMPKNADLKIGGRAIVIQNHKVVSYWSLFHQIVQIARDWENNRQTLAEFEKYGISFEITIEYCVWELENYVNVLAEVLDWQLNNTDVMRRFSKSAAGRKMADMYIEKIRSCDDWGDLYEEMQLTSEFTKDMKSRINVDC